MKIYPNKINTLEQLEKYFIKYKKEILCLIYEHPKVGRDTEGAFPNLRVFLQNFDKYKILIGDDLQIEGKYDFSWYIRLRLLPTPHQIIMNRCIKLHNNVIYFSI